MKANQHVSQIVQDEKNNDDNTSSKMSLVLFASQKQDSYIHKYITLNLKASQKQPVTLERMKYANLKFPQNEGGRGLALLFSIKVHWPEKQTNTKMHCLSRTATLKNVLCMTSLASQAREHCFIHPAVCL